jgi:hypothetical protein
MPRVQLPDGRIVEFPDGMSEQDMAAALQTLAPSEPTASGPDAIDKAAGWLPAVGGMVGGIAGMAGGPVVAAGLSGLGGAAGRAGQRVIEGLRGRDIPQGMDLAQDVGIEGAKQGAMELGGGMVGRGIKTVGGKLARRMYQGLAKPTKALRQEYPDLIETAVRERIPITQGGARTIEQKLATSRGDASQLLARAEDLGAVPVSPREVIGEFAPVIKELRKRADIGQAGMHGESLLSPVGARGRRLVKGGDIPLERAQELKNTAQTAASGAYRQLDRGVAKELSPDDLLDKATATGLRKAIEKRVPEIAAVNKRSQSLGGVERMLEASLGREGNTLGVGGMRDVIAAGTGAGLGSMAGPVGAGGGAAAGALLMRLLSAPGTGSKAALGLARAGDAAPTVTPQMLRVLRQLMSSHEQEP